MPPQRILADLTQTEREQLTLRFERGDGNLSDEEKQFVVLIRKAEVD
jgi:hypothetical protein